MSRTKKLLLSMSAATGCIDLTPGAVPSPKPISGNRKDTAWRWMKNAPAPRRRKRVGRLNWFQLTGPPGVPVIEPVRPDQLKAAQLVRPTSIRLTFADDFEATLPVGRLGMPVDRIRWKTVRVTDNGETLTVTAVKGEPVPVAATTLRYLTDPAYAATIDARVNKLSAFLDELDHTGETPAGMFDSPEPDPVMESWK
jgi:hypothetical protein